MNISLSILDFKRLVKGEVVEKGDTRIILQDIGFAFMRQAIDAAEQGGPEHDGGD